MGEFKGILALFTSCLALCIVVNFLLFYKEKSVVIDGLVLGAFVFFNQLIEFVSSFWLINNTIVNFIYISTFNFAISFSSYYLLKIIQPDSKHNWKAFMFSIMLLPAGFVYLSTFKMMEPGLFFTEYRYFASPLANYLIGLMQAFWGLYFFYKLYFTDKELRKLLHYKLLFWGYTIAPAVFICSLLVSEKSAFYFESIYSKLLILNTASLLYFLIKTKKQC